MDGANWVQWSCGLQIDTALISGLLWSDNHILLYMICVSFLECKLFEPVCWLLSCCSRTVPGHGILMSTLCYPVCSRTVPGCGGCWSRPPPGPVYPGAWTLPEAYCSFGSQWHLQAFPGAGADCGGCWGHSTSGSDDSEPRLQTQGSGKVL